MRGVIPALERAQFLRPAMAAILIVTLFLAFTPQPTVRADEYLVTTNYNTGPGSLRQAIIDANGHSGLDTITFDMTSIAYSIIYYDGYGGDGSSTDLGELIITDSVDIIGPGRSTLTICQRDFAADLVRTRILHIMEGATEVSISGLGFRYGETSDADPGAGSEVGGAIYNETADLTLTDCFFYKNKVGDGGDSADGGAGDGGCGGAVYCAAGDLTITNCLFMYNEAGRGGNSGSFDTLSTGTGAGSGGDGGAVYFAGGTLVVEDTPFYYNESGRGGWLEYCVDGSSGGPGGCGGTIYATGCTAVTVENCEFTDNVASAGGGQSYDDDEGIPEPVPANMNGLGAVGGHGGAMYVVSTALTLDECTFGRNFAGQGGESVTEQAGDGGRGGALYADGGSVAATECDFWDNEAGGGGAGLPGYAGAGGHGGAIYASNAGVTLATCELTDSYAGRGWGGTPGDEPEGTGTGIGGSGGAIYTESGTLTLSESLLAENCAGQGGYDDYTSDWADSGNGGAVYCSNSVDDALDADRCAFVDNGYAEQGGGIYVATGTARLVNCTIGENYAAEGGGVFGVDGSSLRLSFCTVSDNNADIRGGGIASYSTLLRGCVVADNKLDEFDEGDAPTPPTPDDGPDIYHYTSSVVSYGGNVFGTATGSGFSVVALASSPPDVLGADPGLTSLCDDCCEFPAYPLSGGSPALDLIPAGYGTTIDDDPVLVDQCGAERPADGDGDGEALWDAGAFESDLQVFTVPSATGTGDITIRADNGLIVEVDAVAVDEACCIVPEGFYSPHGLVEFYIVGLPEDDEADEPAVVTLTFTFPEDIPVGAMYGKCDEGICEWIDVTHLLGDDDGDEVLTLTLTDGGDGDMDHDWDGEIEDPGGVLLAVMEEPEEKAPDPRRETPPAPTNMNTSYVALGATQALPGQAIQVSVNVCNGGEVKGSQSVVLSVNGVAEQSQTVAVSGGSCKTVVFTVAKSVPGTYDIDVNGMHGQFTVLAPRLVQASVPSQQDNALGTAGIVAIVAVMVVLVLGLVVVFRRS